MIEHTRSKGQGDDITGLQDDRAISRLTKGLAMDPCGWWTRPGRQHQVAIVVGIGLDRSPLGICEVLIRTGVAKPPTARASGC